MIKLVLTSNDNGNFREENK